METEMTIEKFGMSMRMLFQTIAGHFQSNEQSLRQKVAELSSQNTELRKLLDEAVADDDRQKVVAAQELSVKLDELSTELEQEFNPSLAVDAVVAAVVQNEEFDTTALEAMPQFTAVGTNEPTSPAVLDAAIEAVVETLDTVE